jgi:hypothetical protein
MSDPMTNVEIEDVLSSIRRLVSEDLRGPDRAGGSAQDKVQTAFVQSIVPQKRVIAAPAAQAKLVLTPALRVTPVVDDISGRADTDGNEVLAAKGAAASDAGHEGLWTEDARADAATARAATDERALDLEDASPHAGMPDGSGAQPAAETDPVEARGSSAWREAAGWSGTLYDAAAARAAVEFAGDDPDEDRAGQDPVTLESTIAELEAAVAGIDDGFEPDGTPPDGDYAGPVMHFRGGADGDIVAAEAWNTRTAGADAMEQTAVPQDAQIGLEQTEADVAPEAGLGADPDADVIRAQTYGVGDDSGDADDGDLYVIGGYEPAPEGMHRDDEALVAPISGFAMDLPGADEEDGPGEPSAFTSESALREHAAGDGLTAAVAAARAVGARRLTLAVSPEDVEGLVPGTADGAGGSALLGSGGTAETARSPRIIRPAEFGHAGAPESEAAALRRAAITGPAPDDGAEEDGLFRHMGGEASVGSDAVPRTDGRHAANDDDDAGVLDAADEVVIDADALRELVAEIIREELQGALGERITRNVRKLVRREIARALETRPLE